MGPSAPFHAKAGLRLARLRALLLGAAGVHELAQPRLGVADTQQLAVLGVVLRHGAVSKQGAGDDDSRTLERRSLDEETLTQRSTLRMVVMKPTWKTGRASSRWPK